jgi:hypothetical protein
VGVTLHLLARWSEPRPEIAQRLDIDPKYITPTIDVTSPAGVYLPPDLPTAVEELRNMLPSDVLNRLSFGEEAAAFVLNCELGAWLAPHWHLSSQSQLAQYFRAEGIGHPEDMTAIIFDALVRDVSGQPWSVSEQLDCGRRLSKQRDEPSELSSYVFTCR